MAYRLYPRIPSSYYRNGVLDVRFDGYREIIKGLGNSISVQYLYDGRKVLTYVDRYISPRQSITIVLDHDGNILQIHSFDMSRMFSYIFPGFQKYKFLIEQSTKAVPFPEVPGLQNNTDA